MTRTPLIPILRAISVLLFVIVIIGCVTAGDQATHIQPPIESRDHSQWGRSPRRNNVVTDPVSTRTVPITWDVGSFNDDTGDWQPGTGKHIKWTARLGSNSFGNPVVTGGKVFIGTNNDRGYLARFPAGKVDLGVLLCFDAKDGRFLWQYSSEKLEGGDRHDFAGIGICSSPYVEGNRVWFVNNRCEVVCLDANGFRDGKNDGVVTDEAVTAHDEADVIWRFDMRGRLGVQPLFMSNCSITVAFDALMVTTSNATDERGDHIPAPAAPSFIVLEKATGELHWQDSSPGDRVLHGSWSSPTLLSDRYGVVIYPGGDGWLYAFNLWSRFPFSGQGQPSDMSLAWRFDCNPKESIWQPGGRGDRNGIIATPVVTENNHVLIATGQNPEFGTGPGMLWCIDLDWQVNKTRHAFGPTDEHIASGKDLSEQLVVNPLHDGGRTPVPPQRERGFDPKKGDTLKANPSSAVAWKYQGYDLNHDGKLAFDETFHRSISSVVVKDGLVIAVDLDGIVHCLDLRSGKPHWTHDTLAGCWGSPLIVDNRVYLGTDAGHLFVFALSKEKKLLAQNDMGESVCSTPIVADGVLYIATRTRLFAICDALSEP
ncbi:MAG: PQQ-binding-like beta-propeller repeat protein [Phycisphaeraceae bacterium]